MVFDIIYQQLAPPHGPGFLGCDLACMPLHAAERGLKG